MGIFGLGGKERKAVPVDTISVASPDQALVDLRGRVRKSLSYLLSGNYSEEQMQETLMPMFQNDETLVGGMIRSVGELKNREDGKRDGLLDEVVESLVPKSGN